MPEYPIPLIAVVLLFIGGAIFDRYRKRADQYAQQRQYPEAISAYTCLLRLNRKNRDVLLRRGWVHFQVGDLEAAIEDHNKVIQMSPRDGSNYRLRGIIHARQKNYDLALRDYDQAIRLNPEAANETYLNRAHLWVYDKENYQAGIDDYTAALKIVNANLEKSANLTHHKRDGFDVELKNYAAAIYSARADAHRFDLNFDAAISDYITAINLHPDFADYESDLARAYLSNKQPNEAIEHYDRAVSLKPADISLLVRRGSAYYDMENYERCIADCNQVIILEPENAIGYINRAEAYFALGSYAEALADYLKAQSLDATANLVTAGLAITRFKLGEATEAKQLWAKLLEKDSQFSDMAWVGTELHWAKPLVEAGQQLIDQSK